PKHPSTIFFGDGWVSSRGLPKLRRGLVLDPEYGHRPGPDLPGLGAHRPGGVTRPPSRPFSLADWGSAGWMRYTLRDDRPISICSRSGPHLVARGRRFRAPTEPRF